MRAPLPAMLCAGLLTACPPPRMNPSPDPTAVRVVEGDVDARRLLGEAVEVAEAAGAEGLDLVGARVLAEGEQLGSFAEVPPGACILALAAPGQSVRDVDLFVYGDDGARLGGDESPAGRAAAMVCPPHPRRVYVTARAMAGQGFVALAVMQVAPERADAVAEAVHVRGRPGEDTGKLAAWPGLEQTIREHRRALGTEWEDVRRAAVPVDPAAATAISVAVAPRRCLDVLVVPSDEVPSVDVQLVDADGRVVSRGRPPGRNRSLLVCSEIERTLTLLVRPRSSTGLVAVAIARTREGAGRELFSHPTVLAPAPIGTLDEARGAWREATGPWGGDVSEHAVTDVGATAPARITVKVDPGCTRLGALGAAPLGPFEASLWDATGLEVDQALGSRWATLFHCSPRAQTLAVELLSQGRRGPAAVLSRTVEAPPLLAAHGQAGARVLHRLEDAGSLGALDAVTWASVDAAPRRQVQVTAPSQEGCQLWVHAVDGPEQGLALRLLGRGGKLLRLTRGLGTVATTVCEEDGVVGAAIAVDERAAKVLSGRVPAP